MHRYSRMHLTPDAGMRTMVATYKGETSQLAENIAVIAVIDYRRDYLAYGYSCMLNCCMGRLEMSKDQALRRIQVAHTAMRVPELFEYLEDGRLGITTASVLAPHLEPGTASALLAAAARRTQREVEQLVAQRRRPALASSASADEPVVESTSGPYAAPHTDSYFELTEPVAEAPSSPRLAALNTENRRRGRVFPCVTGGHEVRLSITDEEHDDLRAVLALLGHAVPSGDPALVYARAMKLLRAQLEKRRLGVKPGAAVPAGPGRGIPKPLARLIWERDGGRCTFESADGHRCGETRQLEIGHIQPVSLGGKSTPENLRLLCRAHNQYEAERVLGREHEQCRRDLARRERARDKVAATAISRRTKGRSTTRNEEQQARYDDIYAGLKGLGATDAEAKRGAEMADAMPDANTGACLKAALTELARPVVLRGERRAGCSE